MILAAINRRNERRRAFRCSHNGVILVVASLVLLFLLNLGCGGGSSGGSGTTPPPPPPPSTTQVLNLAANQIVYDSSRQRLYASVGSLDNNHPNTIAFIDVASATITTTVAVGGDNPNRLALSRDGAYLYVGVDGISSVQRINLVSNAIDETIALGSDTSGNLFYAGDIEVMPGSPGTIAVVRMFPNPSPPPHAVDVAIFDGTMMRPNTASPFGTSVYAIDVIAFSDSGNALYGLDNESSDFAFVRMSVDSGGLSIQDMTQLLLGYGYGATMAYSSGLIYSTFGSVANPSSLILEGTLPANPSSLLPHSGPFAESVFVDEGVPYLLTGAPNNGPTITSYDPQTYLEIAAVTVNIPGSDDETSLVKCGGSCFAFIEYAGLPNITTSVVISTAPLRPVSTASATLNNLSPNHIVWNPAAGRLYASIPGEAGPWGNSVAIINPSTQAIENTVFVGSEPDVMALSPDGAYLYVGLDGAWSVARLNLATSAVDLTFFLGLDPFLPGPTLPASISVSPGDSTTVAVARINPKFQPNDELVTIYQQGMMLPNVTNDVGTVAFCNSGSALYGLDNQISGAFFTMSVDGAGVRQTGVTEGLIGGGNIICDTNVIYASTGYAVDPFTDKQLGIFPGLVKPIALSVDDTNKKLFFLDNGSNNAPAVVGFDQTSYIRTGTLPVTAATSPGRDLARWGTDGIAVATQNQIVLLTGGLP